MFVGKVAEDTGKDKREVLRVYFKINPRKTVLESGMRKPFLSLLRFQLSTHKIYHIGFT